MPISAWAKLPTRVLVIAAAGLTVAGVAACDTKSGPVPAAAEGNVRQVTVVGEGKVQGTPDTVTVSAAIESIAPDASSALNQTNQRMTAVTDAVANQGIDRKDISTTGITLSPQYGDNSVITAYQASNSIE